VELWEPQARLVAGDPVDGADVLDVSAADGRDVDALNVSVVRLVRDEEVNERGIFGAESLLFNLTEYARSGVVLHDLDRVLFPGADDAAEEKTRLSIGVRSRTTQRNPVHRILGRIVREISLGVGLEPDRPIRRPLGKLDGGGGKLLGSLELGLGREPEARGCKLLFLGQLGERLRGNESREQDDDGCAKREC
jgi:hypothetical protein